MLPSPTPLSFYGMKVIVHPSLSRPKVKLSHVCPCSDVIRDDFNKWLLEKFGEDNKNFLFMALRNEVYVTPLQYEQLKQQLRS